MIIKICLFSFFYSSEKYIIYIEKLRLRLFENALISMNERDCWGGGGEDFFIKSNLECPIIH